MYGSLGYIDNGRRAPTRQNHFLGTSGNPARKEMNGAYRPEDMAGVVATAAPSAVGTLNSSQALMDRRCMFLEEQNRRREAEIAQLRGQLTDVAARSQPPPPPPPPPPPRAVEERVRGVVVCDTVEVDDVETRTEPARVARGTRVTLSYPMRETADGSTRQIWMKRRRVDPVLASITYTWLRLYEGVQEGDDVRDVVYVSEFT